jgi:energy-coupling factor transport system ATP-binding protein
MSEQLPFIEVKDLVYTYTDGTQALRGIDLTVSDGEFIAFIGQNGSGKTTLSKCLNGLFKPTSGSVIVDGLDSRHTSIVQMVKRVGYVFQNPDHQLFNSNCWDEVAYGPRNIGLDEEEVKVRVAEAARVVGLREEYFTEHPFFLNKGMRQRVAIASILALKPKVIIVDEPTTGQDIRQSMEIMDFLRDLNENYGHIIIFITHDMPIVSSYSKRVVVMGLGEIIVDGPPAEVFAAPELLAKTLIEPPQITELAQRLSDLGFNPGTLTVKEMITQYEKLCPGSKGSMGQERILS